MNKSKRYNNTFFTTEIIDKAISKLKKMTNQSKIEPSTLLIDFDNERWEHNNISEFFSDYIKNPREAHFNIFHEKNGFAVHYYSSDKRYTDIGVNGNDRKEIEEIYNIFDSNADKCHINEKLDDEEKIIKIFIGHGRKSDWIELANHLNYKHGYNIEAYETGARAGHTIRDVLEYMLDNSSFALLVLTGEDLMTDEKIRARQNVIHEAGLFQGRLGFNRAIMVVEEGIENFSNVDGIQQIRFTKGNIKECFGDVLATLKREFE